MKKPVLAFLAVMAFLFAISVAGAGVASADTAAVAVSLSGTRATFTPLVPCGSLQISVVTPDGEVFATTSAGDGPTVLDFSTPAGPLPDGSYQYELRLGASAPRTRARIEPGSGLGAEGPAPVIQTGLLVVANGVLAVPTAVEESQSSRAAGSAGVAASPVPQDVVHNDDLIVVGSVCAGFNCINNEVFGLENLKLKQVNNRIFLDDTSVGSYPANDWAIVANDSDDSGFNYLAFEDLTSSKTPFKVMAGAPTNSLYVSSAGNLGLGTSAPAREVHVVDGDTPTIRLTQDSSNGFPLRSYDLGSNEGGLFVYDVNGEKYPFTLAAGAPSDSLKVASDGKIGIGTSGPLYAVEVVRTGVNAAVVTNRTDGAKNFMNSSATAAQFGAVNNYPVRILVNSSPRLTLNTNDSMTHVNGATLTSGGVWQNASSRALKENIRELTADEARATLLGLTPVRYTYKAAAGEHHVGFIAEDVPELVAAQDRKSLSPMDITAVLTRTVQEQQQVIEQQERTIRALTERFSALEAQVGKLRGRVIVGSLP